MSADTSLGQDLYGHLVDVLHESRQERQPSTRWVMNTEWLLECRKIEFGGRSVWAPSVVVTGEIGPDFLLGIPLEVRDDGGFPHLETL